jgi:hypothetical protein
MEADGVLEADEQMGADGVVEVDGQMGAHGVVEVDGQMGAHGVLEVDGRWRWPLMECWRRIKRKGGWAIDRHVVPDGLLFYGWTAGGRRTDDSIWTAGANGQMRAA